MLAAILAIVAGLIGALPQILTLIERRTLTQKRMTHALATRSLTELSAGADGVLGVPPVPPQ